jgi:hypothetical protein
MKDDPDWDAIRRAYEDHSIPTRDTVVKFGVDKLLIYRRAVTDKWLRRPSPFKPSVPKAQQTQPLPQRDDPAAGAPLPAASEPPAAAYPLPGAIPASDKAIDLKTLKPIAKRRAILNRLTDAIDTKLQLLERRFEHELASADTRSHSISSADFERDTRNIGLLIKNLEQVTDFDHAHSPGKRITGAAAKSVSVATSALVDEADRLRRELAERLQRLVDTAA